MKYRMSVRWLLCNYCRSSCCSKTDDAESERSHLYCGCQVPGKRSKMLESFVTTAEADREILISKASEAIDYDFLNKSAKEEWESDNPSVPFHSEFCDTLEANRAITILGIVNTNALNFTVNFCKGTGESADIGLHINPRFDQHYVPRNCRLSCSWGEEEAQTYCKYPFRRGKQFFIEIFLTHNEFLVAIDGLHFCAFRYRYPIYELDSIEIFGGVSLDKVKFIVSKQYPSVLPQSCDIEPSHSFSIPGFLPENYMLNLSNYNTPHVISFKQPMSVGNEININGRVKLLPYSFYINLQEGSCIWPHPTISLHLNVRFKQMSSTTSSVLVNAWQGNRWGEEKYASENCFLLPGQPFTLQILCTTDAYHLSHNGRPIIFLEHRTDYTKVDTMYIVGDILLDSISFR